MGAPAPGAIQCLECDERAERLTKMLAVVDSLIPKRFQGLEVEVPAIREWVRGVVEGSETEGLLLGGPSGPGKTGNAYAALRLAVKCGFLGSVRVEKAVELVQGLDLNEQRERIGSLQRAGLVLLDDLGAHVRGKDWSEANLLRVIDTRWENERPTIVTTNIDKVRLVGLHNAVLGERIASRLSSYRWVQMGGSDLAASDRRGERL